MSADECWMGLLARHTLFRFLIATHHTAGLMDNRRLLQNPNPTGVVPRTVSTIVGKYSLSSTFGLEYKHDASWMRSGF